MLVPVRNSLHVYVEDRWLRSQHIEPAKGVKLQIWKCDKDRTAQNWYYDVNKKTIVENGSGEEFLV